MDVLEWSRHFRCFPGQGEFDLAGFLAPILRTGYRGPLSLEVFNDGFRAAPPRQNAADGLRSLLYLEEKTARRLAKDGAAIEPGVLFSPPPASRYDGVEFLEFAVDEAAAPGLERVLAGLGFHKAGVHKSKAVARWQQGGINLVINAEKEGFAHSFNLMHGTSVCAMALKVDDAAATFERARMLCGQPFHQPVLPGELEIPAIRGLGGSLVYFIDPKSALGRWWEIDFKPSPAPHQDAALAAFDHISQSMHYEEMLTWLLFYTSLLDVSKAPAQDVIDPGGLVRSQAIETADGSLRLVLNASQSSRTLSSRFLSETFGSGVQHIAFASRDIMQSVERFRAAGIELLPIPENYYDDLEAKTDLSAETLAALKAANVLYDRDAEAEYLQVYTRTFDERFFFEIVERRGYRGFGAANAPIRLAAQARLADHARAIAMLDHGA